ncbi:MAG: hypothetical protein CL847_02105 [Crocinitomicaceae bacterium]|nr:hypothetical protein [Crocinitomicaceae bacterium]|tara:strand:+ start:12562 stop:13353 length:792 start_codon:yes stop_codon:yes gene_type:complete
MKLKITAFLPFAFIASFSLMSHHNGVAEEQNKDRTGAPGSVQSCTHCHSPVIGVNTLSNIVIMDSEGNEVEEYMPGNDYFVSFIVTDDNAEAFGFQATAVHSDGSNARSFSNLGTNVQLEDVDGRHIVEQSDPLVIGIFTATWSAPTIGAGDVAFYMAGLAVNLAHGNNGDSHHATAISLTEGIHESVIEIGRISNPIADSDGIVWNAHTNGRLNVCSIDGKLNSSNFCLSGATVFVPTSNNIEGLQLVQFIPTNLDQFAPKT